MHRNQTPDRHGVMGMLWKSEKRSLTFWLIAGMLVWLALCRLNGIFGIHGDVWKLFIGCGLGYALFGLILGLPISIASALVRSVLRQRVPAAGVEITLHVVLAVILTGFYPVHRIWYPDISLFSKAGLLEIVALLGTGFALGLLTAVVVSLGSRLRWFQSQFRVLATALIVSLVIYAARSVVLGAPQHEESSIPDSLKTPYATNQRVLLIGFDAATWDAIDPLLREGRLPNFERLLQNGIRSPLKSSRPTSSAILWATISTGKTASQHGVVDNVTKVTPGLRQNAIQYPYLCGSYQLSELLLRLGAFDIMPVSSLARRTKALWNILTDYGDSTVVAGWWGTFPPEAINGVIVSDQASANKQQLRRVKGQLSDQAEMTQEMPFHPVYPPSLEPEILGLGAQTSSMTLEELRWFFPADSAEWERFNSMANWTRRYPESAMRVSFLADKFFRLAVEDLLSRNDYNLVLSYFFEVDAVSHWAWCYRRPDLFPELPKADVLRYGGLVDSTYVNADRILGSLLDKAGDKYNIIVISDHGFGIEYDHSRPTANHAKAPDGILIMSGPAISRTGKFREPPRLLDITPTILTLLGIPVGRDMHGRVLTETLKPEFLQQFPLRTIPSHDYGKRFIPRAIGSAEEEYMMERLRALNYIQ